MINVSISTSESGTKKIRLGRQGENEVRQVVFDLNSMVERYGDGLATLVYQRNGDMVPYVINAIRSENSLKWLVDSTDTAKAGPGRAEIRWYVSGALAKTVIFTTETVESMSADTEVPDAFQSWYDKMVDYVDAQPQIVIGEVQRVVEGKADAAEVDNVYAKKTDIPTKLSKFTNDAGYLKAVPSEYVTDSELEARKYLTQHQDISGKADRTDMDVLASRFDNVVSAVSSDTELTDIRVTIDGNIEETAGTAVRKQVQGLSNEIKKLLDVSRYEKHADDADHIYQVKTGIYKPVDDPVGTRIRVIYYLTGHWSGTIQCEYGKGAAVALYEDLDHAIGAADSLAIEIYSHNYKTTEISVDTGADGYLSVSLCKSDSTAFTPEEKEAALSALQLELFSDDDTSMRLNRMEVDITSLESKTDNVDSRLAIVEAVKDQTLDLLSSAEWEQRTYSASSGKPQSSINTSRICTTKLIDIPSHADSIDYSVDDGYQFWLLTYDQNENLISTSWWISGSGSIILASTICKIAFVIANTSETDISIEEANHLSINCIVSNPIISSIEAGESGLSTYKYLYLGKLVNGHMTASGLRDNNYTQYRLSSRNIIALPRGSNRKLNVQIRYPYLFALFTGARADNLNHSQSWFRGDNVFIIPDGDNYYAISIAIDAQSSSKNVFPISESDINLMGLKITYEEGLDIPFSNAEAEKTLDAARFLFSTSDPNILNSYPVIAHTSDCHGDYQRVKNFFDFCDRIGGVDLAAVTGDIVAYQPRQGLDWFHDLVKTAKTKVAICAGNHDVYDSNMSDEDAYNFIFSDIAETIGSVTEKNWYYTDLDDKKLRVISIYLYEFGGTTRNYTHFTETQLNWLCSTLADTPDGYGVLLLYHSPQISISGVSPDQEFRAFYQDIHKYSNIYSGVTGSPINDIIDAFISRTSINKTYVQTGEPSSVTVSADFSDIPADCEFIAHLTGHFHQDTVYHMNNTVNKQLMLNVTCTNALYGSTAYPYLADVSDIPRNNLDSTQDAFNVYVIDRINKKVKIVRVGSNMTYQMRERKYMEISYAD